jgi:hypothetical protein
LDYRHVCKTCAFYDALQAGKQKEVHPPYSHYLAPAGTRLGELTPSDFFLFPRLKFIMKGARFADVAAIQKCVTTVLRSIPKESFADNFQNLCERGQKCVVKDGDYFEGQST